MPSATKTTEVIEARTLRKGDVIITRDMKRVYRNKILEAWHGKGCNGIHVRTGNAHTECYDRLAHVEVAS